MAGKKNHLRTDLGRKEAEAVTWPDSDVLHDLLRFCWPRNIPAEQPPLEKEQGNGSTAFCRSVEYIKAFDRMRQRWFCLRIFYFLMKETCSTQG